MYRHRVAVFILVSLIALISLPVFSQEAEGTLYTPFISRLQAEARNNLVRLTWIDSPTAKGSVYIYRSQTPFDDKRPDTFGKPIEVPYGIQSYIDETEVPGVWYYFIIASNDAGERYTVPIPYNNMISVTVHEMAVAGGASKQSADSKIYSIMAEVRGGGIMISYQTKGEGQMTILYRSINPIRQMKDLLNAVILRSLSGAPYMDYPIGGIPNYYAILLEDDLISGTAAIYPGLNATIKPVEVAADLPVSSPVRSIPLPLISTNALSPAPEGFGISPEMPKKIPLSPRAEESLIDVPPYKGPSRVRKISRIFTQDLELPLPMGGGEDYLLRSIMQGSFQTEDWSGAQEELLRYLALPRSHAAEARARYYLGQTYFFTGAFREALFEFLRVQSQYPDEIVDWIQATLRELTVLN